VTHRATHRRLVTAPNIDAPDDFYAALSDLYRDLDDAESAKANAKLVLLLANHIGDSAVLMEAIDLARPQDPA
jgi:3-(3-hydroxy-phenyl)propionate hydroxylase